MKRQIDRERKKGAERKKYRKRESEGRLKIRRGWEK